MFVGVRERELERWTPYRGRTDYTVGHLACRLNDKSKIGEKKYRRTSYCCNIVININMKLTLYNIVVTLFQLE